MCNLFAARSDWLILSLLMKPRFRCYSSFSKWLLTSSIFSSISLITVLQMIEEKYSLVFWDVSLISRSFYVCSIVSIIWYSSSHLISFLRLGFIRPIMSNEDVPGYLSTLTFLSFQLHSILSPQHHLPSSLPQLSFGSTSALFCGLFHHFTLFWCKWLVLAFTCFLIKLCDGLISPLSNQLFDIIFSEVRKECYFFNDIFNLCRIFCFECYTH